MFIVSIPSISDEELKRRYEQIKPIISENGKLYHLREFSFDQLTGISYLWNHSEDKRDEVKENELEVLKGYDFSCIHRYGYYGLFKPSIADVLAQIDEHILPFVKAFEIIESPQTVSDFHKDGLTSIIFDNGYHVSTVRLYSKKT